MNTLQLIGVTLTLIFGATATLFLCYMGTRYLIHAGQLFRASDWDWEKCQGHLKGRKLEEIFLGTVEINDPGACHGMIRDSNGEIKQTYSRSDKDFELMLK